MKTSRVVVSEITTLFNPKQPKVSLLEKYLRKAESSKRYFGDPLRAIDKMFSLKVADPYVDSKGMAHFTIIEVFFGDGYRIAKWTNVRELGNGYGSIASYL